MNVWLSASCVHIRRNGALASESRGGKASRCIGRGRAHLPFHERRRGGCVAGPSLVAVDVAEHRPCRLRGCGRPPHSRRKCARRGAVDELDRTGPSLHPRPQVPAADNRITQARLICSPSTRYRFGFTHRWGRQGARSRGGRRRPKRRAGLPRWGSEEHRTPRRTRPEVCCRRMEPRRDQEMRRNRRTVRSSGLSVTRQVRRRRKVGCCTHGPNIGESTVLGPRIERVLDQEPRDKVV